MRTDRFVRGRYVLAAAAVCAMLLPALAGCQCGPLASVRYSETAFVVHAEPTLAASPASSVPLASVDDAADTFVSAATESAEAFDAPTVPRLADVDARSDRMSSDEPADPPSPEEAFAEPPESGPREMLVTDPGPTRSGIGSERVESPPASRALPLTESRQDGEDLCENSCCDAAHPPRFARPRCNWRCRLGPLFCRHGVYDEGALAEAQLQPPFARFHPVPTAPVFAPRYEYEPPQLMLVPVDTPHAFPRPFAPHGEPGQLSPPLGERSSVPVAPVPEVVPLSDEAPVETAPTPAAAPTTRPNWRATTIHRHRYAG